MTLTQLVGCEALWLQSVVQTGHIYRQNWPLLPLLSLLSSGLREGLQGRIILQKAGPS